MTRLTKTIALLPALCLLLGAPLAAAADPLDQIARPPLGDFAPAQPKRVELANGLTLLLLEDHELPLVRGYALIRGGARDEPASKVGLVSILGDSWRAGGTATSSGDALDEFLESRAAVVETWGQTEATGISWDCLRENADEVIDVVVELLTREPAFAQDKIDLAKTTMNTVIARRNDDPDGIASRESSRLAYGPSTPYGRIAEYDTVAAVTRDDLLAWHRRYVKPNNTVIAVSGDFDAATMERQLRAKLGPWQRGEAPAPLDVQLSGPTPGIYLITKNDVTQSKIHLVHLGTRRDSPDFFALEVMNQIFGGAFSARLMTNVRAKEGLAYTVRGGVGMSYDYPGLMSVRMGTGSQNTVRGIQALLTEIDRMHESPPDTQELATAKEAILNSFIFRIDSKEKVLRQKAQDLFFGYPDDFLESYRDGIQRVTSDDVQRVARDYLRKDKLAILVVGKPDDFGRPLSELGPVTALDVSIPAPGASARPASDAAAAGEAEKTALLNKIALGFGGREVVERVRALHQVMNVRAQSPQGEMDLSIDLLLAPPDRVRQEITLPMGVMIVAVSPDDAFMMGPMGVQDLPASQRQEALDQLKTSGIHVVQRSDDPSLRLVPGGTETVGGVSALILDVTLGGAEVRWWIDPETGRILRTASTVATMGPPQRQVVTYSDWRELDGIEVPVRGEITRDGAPYGAFEITKLEINPTVDPGIFVRP